MDYNKKDKSTKTTVAGIALLISLITGGIAFLLDGNPETNPDWAGIVEAIRGAGLISGGVFAGLLGKFSQDDKKGK